MPGLRQAVLGRAQAQGVLPACGGELVETEERRRQTKGGFETRKACQAAMVKLLVAVEERTNVVPTRVIVRDYLLKHWLPAIKGTIRPTTYAGYKTACEQHVIPTLGSWQLQRLTGATLNGLYAQLAKDGRCTPKVASPPPRYVRSTRRSIAPARCGQVGLPRPQPGRRCRPTQCLGPARRATGLE